MGNLVICGDSFSVGIGCHDLNTEPFGSLLGKTLEKNVINLAKGSSTNLSIFLQVKYAIENIKDIDLVIVGTTSFNRIEWFPEGVDLLTPLDNTNVNYHQYPPYGEETYQTLLDNPMKNDIRYKGEMFTENWVGVIDYVDKLNDPKFSIKKSGNLAKFKNESDEKMTLLRDFYLNFFDERIQKHYDIGVITMAHLLLERNHIKHYILIPDWTMDIFGTFILKTRLINIDWGRLSLEYPDVFKTMHTSSKGHQRVYEAILNVINKRLI